MMAEMEDVPLRLERQLLAGDKLRHRDLGREVAPQLVTNGLEGAPLSDWSVRRTLDLDGNVRPLWMAGEVRDVGEHGLRGDIYLDAALDHRHRGLLSEWGVWWRILYPVRLARTLGGLDEGANLRDVLHAVGLDAGGDVDGPGVDYRDGAGDVVRPQAAGEHHRLLGGHLRRDRPVQGDAGAAVRPLDVGIQQEEGAAVHLRQHPGGGLALADLQALQNRPLDERADLPGLGAGELDEVEAALPRDAVDRVGVLVGEDADQQRTARAQALLHGFDGGGSGRGGALAEGVRYATALAHRHLAAAGREDDADEVGAVGGRRAGVSRFRYAADLNEGHANSSRIFAAGSRDVTSASPMSTASTRRARHRSMSARVKTPD